MAGSRDPRTKWHYHLSAEVPNKEIACSQQHPAAGQPQARKDTPININLDHGPNGFTPSADARRPITLSTGRVEHYVRILVDRTGPADQLLKVRCQFHGRDFGGIHWLEDLMAHMFPVVDPELPIRPATAKSQKRLPLAGVDPELPIRPATAKSQKRLPLAGM